MSRLKKKGPDRRQTLITSGIIILTAAALAAGAVFAARQFWRRVSSRPEFRVSPIDFAISDPWIRQDALRRDFIARDPEGVLAQPVSLYTPGLTQRVAVALSRSPWVRQVRSVTKQFPNRLRVDMELREPYALIKVGQRYYCVDEESVALDPGVYLLTSDRLVSLAPAAVVPAGVSVPQAGHAWNDVAVREGLAMVRLCRENLAKNVSVAEIEIENEKSAGGAGCAMATLVLSAGPRVRWGRTPDSPPSPSEIRTSQKAEALLALTRQEGEAISKFRSIDVRLSRPICE